jgi:type IV pilus assembly protein PilM
MPVPQGVWGIDLGQSALKAIRLELIDGVVTATAFDFIEHPKILSQPDADPDQLTREALETFLSRNDLKGDEVAVSVPGQSGLARFVKLPPVEEKKIGDIVRFEAKQQIPFPLDEVVWDFQKIGSGEVTDGFAMETEIGLFAMKRDQISRSLAHFQDVNIEVHYIQMAPLALCNFVAYDQLNKGGTPAEGAEEPADEGPRGKRRCVVALDIGTDSSNLVITDGEKIIWQRPIPLGGNHLTRALSKEMKLTFAKAEHLKRNAAKSPPELKAILTALKPVLGDFVGEVQRSLGFFTNSHRDAQVQYMVGLGSAFRLPGFQKYLAEKLQLDVRKPAAFNRLVGDDVVNAPVFTENVLSYAVAYGLAVQGLGLSKLRTNLLPQEIRRERLIRAKKPWAVAAACAFFLGAAMLAGGYAINYTAVSAKSITEATKRADDEVKKVSGINKEAEDKVNDVKNLTNDVKSVIAGKDEQLNWIRINEHINIALPNPESANPAAEGGYEYEGGVLRTLQFGPAWLQEKANRSGRPVEWLREQDWIKKQVPFWNTNQAREAWRLYREKVRGGQSANLLMNEDDREHLFLMDIEAVDCLFTDNLKMAFDRIEQITRANQDLLAGMCAYDKANPPKETDAGWVFEIRGSTYQQRGRDFILGTLVENLTRLSRKSTPLDGPAGSTPPAGAPALAAPTADPAADPAKAGPIDPITDKISHVCMLQYRIDTDPKPGTFKAIQESHLKALVSTGQSSEGRGGGPPPGGAPGAPLGMGGPMEASGSSRDSWTPLTSAGGGTSGGSGGGFGGGDGLEGRFGRGGAGGGFNARNLPNPVMGGGGGKGPTPMTSGGGPLGSGGNVPAVAAGKTGKPRFEFVVVFIWKEPTPSDALMKLSDASGAPPADQTPPMPGR